MFTGVEGNFFRDFAYPEEEKIGSELQGTSLEMFHLSEAFCWGTFSMTDRGSFRQIAMHRLLSAVTGGGSSLSLVYQL